MIKTIVIQYLIIIFAAIVSTIFSVITYEVRQLLKSKRNFLEHQRQQLIQKIGIDQYNHDVDVARRVINAVEQEAKAFNWDGLLKHSTAVERITQATGLNTDEIHNIIESFVNEFNKDKPKAGQEIWNTSQPDMELADINSEKSI